jgi:hypothetical protein
MMGTPRTLKKNDLIIERLSQAEYQAGDLVLTYRPTNAADADIILTEITGGGGSGTVESVNGVGPDGAGNVSLTTDLVPEGVTNKYFDEAPIDGNQYARQNGGWSEVTGGGSANGGIAINAAGTLADRATYDNEAEGFVFFQTDFGQGTSVNDVYARYTATSGQTNFTLPFTPTDGPKTVLVTRNNVIQGPTNVYSTSGATLTFTTALEAGDEVTALDLSSVLYGVGAIYIKESAASGDWSVAIPFIGSNAGGGSVDSVFGRIGNVTAQAGDYSSNQVSAPASATNYTPTSQTVLGHLQGVDAALPTAGPIGSDAPADGNQYARRNNAWEAVSGGTGAVDTVNNVSPDGIGNVSLTTTDIPEGTNAYFPEAPTDGNQYARQNGAWTQVSGSGGAVDRIIAGSNVSVSPSGGTGDVTVSATNTTYPAGSSSDIINDNPGPASVWSAAALNTAITTLAPTGAFESRAWIVQSAGSSSIIGSAPAPSWFSSITRTGVGTYVIQFSSQTEREKSVVMITPANNGVDFRAVGSGAIYTIVLRKDGVIDDEPFYLTANNYT